MIYKIQLGESKETVDFSVVNKQINDNMPVILDFSATWCRPCKRIFPSLQNLANAYPNINFYKVDIGEKDEHDLGEKYKISALPTILFLNSGTGEIREEGIKGDAKNIIDSFVNYLSLLENDENDPETKDLKRVELSLHVKSIMNYK